MKIISPIEPVDFGLSPRTILDAVGKNHIAIVIDRKSRIIMSDGKKITEKAETIKKHKPATKVSVKTTAPVCSKTIKFLSENGIEIQTKF